MWRLVFLAAGTAVVAVAASRSSAAGRSLPPKIDPDVPDRGIFSLRPAPRWEEALLVGNGRQGGLVMGKPFDETVMLAHERLFLPLNEDKPTVETASHLGRNPQAHPGRQRRRGGRARHEARQTAGRPRQAGLDRPVLPRL